MVGTSLNSIQYGKRPLSGQRVQEERALAMGICGGGHRSGAPDWALPASPGPLEHWWEAGHQPLPSLPAVDLNGTSPPQQLPMGSTYTRAALPVRLDPLPV